MLDVSENFVSVVEKLSFKDLYLAKINLSHNEISKIEPGAFENCVNMTVLDMSHNKLENISKFSFDASTYATDLQLSYNQFTSLSQVPFERRVNLRIETLNAKDSGAKRSITIAGASAQHDRPESPERFSQPATFCASTDVSKVVRAAHDRSVSQQLVRDTQRGISDSV